MDKVRHLGSDFTTNAISIIDQLEERATARSVNLGSLLPDLLLWTILRWEKNIGVAALELLGVNCWELQQRLDSFLKNKCSYHSIPHPITAVRHWATREASLMGSNYKGTEHLLLGALSAADPDLRSILAGHRIEYDNVKRSVMKVLESNSES
jgi:ATP-dependent Clp protease ATP-binding subunit ClpC